MRGKIAFNLWTRCFRWFQQHWEILQQDKRTWREEKSLQIFIPTVHYLMKVLNFTKESLRCLSFLMISTDNVVHIVHTESGWVLDLMGGRCWLSYGVEKQIKVQRLHQSIILWLDLRLYFLNFFPLLFHVHSLHQRMPNA